MAGGALGLVGLRAVAPAAAQADKVTICHWDADAGVYDQISVSVDGLNGHGRHAHDILAPDFGSDATCGDCNTACVAPATCGGGGVAGACGTSCSPTTVTIFADNPAAVDTGLFLAAGESVTITTSGVASWCGGCGATDANGNAPCGFFGIPFNCGSLVGVVGGGDIFADYTPFFEVGAGPTTITATGAGNLFLQYVDGCPGVCYADNTGSIEVTINAC
jgi:hypothetical protein